MAQQSNIG